MEQGRGMGARRCAPSLVWWIAAVVAAGCGDEASPSNGCPPGMVAAIAGCQLAVANSGSGASSGSGGAAVMGSAGSSTATAGTAAAPSRAGIGGTNAASAGMNANPGSAGMAGTMPPPQSGASGAPAAGSGSPVPMAERSAGCGNASPPADGMQMLDVDGMQRAFIVELPEPYDANKPHQLIFAWHGLGGTGARIASSGFYGLRQRAMGSAIFVAGQGLDTSNQVGSGPGWDNMGGRDVAFTRKMLEQLRTSYCIDNTRIFSTGMSYGGIMSNTVGCALGDDFRAIAPIAGSGPRGNCTGKVAAWIAHGNQDMVVAYASGQRSRDTWVMSNMCQTTTQPAGMNGCVAYQGCAEGHPVVWCEFTGGHTVPTFASAEIWAFFSQF